ncbi:hypothetical protein V1477_008585 [Vespula maculifrons]|uniref:Uncharacterized protein n=1 Tax=Vespula maculifrons TaxID=7453 RepID=A0ABD2CDG1_VESMC
MSNPSTRTPTAAWDHLLSIPAPFPVIPVKSITWRRQWRWRWYSGGTGAGGSGAGGGDDSDVGDGGGGGGGSDSGGGGAGSFFGTNQTRHRAKIRKPTPEALLRRHSSIEEQKERERGRERERVYAGTWITGWTETRLDANSVIEQRLERRPSLSVKTRATTRTAATTAAAAAAAVDADAAAAFANALLPSSAAR